MTLTIMLQTMDPVICHWTRIKMRNRMTIENEENDIDSSRNPAMIQRRGMMLRPIRHVMRARN